jgi:hypothetical protein
VATLASRQCWNCITADYADSGGYNAFCGSHWVDPSTDPLNRGMLRKLSSRGFLGLVCVVAALPFVLAYVHDIYFRDPKSMLRICVLDPLPSSVNILASRNVHGFNWQSNYIEFSAAREDITRMFQRYEKCPLDELAAEQRKGLPSWRDSIWWGFSTVADLSTIDQDAADYYSLIVEGELCYAAVVPEQNRVFWYRISDRDIHVR